MSDKQEKKTIEIASISKFNLFIFITYVASFYLACFGTIFGYLYQNYFLSIGVIFLIIFIFYDIILTNYAPIYLNVKKNHYKWLKLDRTLYIFDFLTTFIVSYILYSPIMFISTNHSFKLLEDVNNRIYYLIVTTFVTILYFRAIRSAQKIFTMGYETVDKLSLFGAAAYADVSNFYFKLNNNIKGIHYLKRSLLILKNILNIRGLKNDKLERIISGLENPDMLGNTEFSNLKNLSIRTSQLPDIDCLNYIDTYLINPGSGFYKLDPYHKEDILTKIIKTPSIVTLITASLAILIPNEYKINILNTITSLSTGLFTLILSILLLLWLIVELAKMRIIDNKDFKEYSKIYK